jgi:phosphoribosylglycinamide formyltransferase-1
MLRLAVFISGGGTNLQALMHACRSKSLDAEIMAVISNNSKAFGLKRAADVGIAIYHISKIKYPDEQRLGEAIMEVLQKHKIDLIVLAGYMKLLPQEVVGKYRGRIINIHPALLPKHGGQGMYGIKVHEAVLQSGDTVSGATVHLVDEEYDRGPILIQRQAPVKPDDTPESLAARVLEIEHQILPLAVKLFIK